MRRTSIALATLFCLTIPASRSSAQPILNRVEQTLRNQLLPQAPAAEPGYLGVIADDQQEQGRGVRVLDVVPGGPAATGGVQAGDLITAINGQPIRVMDDMAQVVERVPAGGKLTIAVDRNGAAKQQEITLGRRPKSQPIGKIPESLPDPNSPPTEVAAPGPRLGVRSLPVSEDAQRKNNLSNLDGAMVISVTVGSPADRAAIPLGSVITAVDGKPIRSPEDLSAAVRAAGAAVELTFALGGQEIRKQVVLTATTPAENPKLELRGRPLSKPEPTAEPDESVTELKARIRTLEERVKELEAALSREGK